MFTNGARALTHGHMPPNRCGTATDSIAAALWSGDEAADREPFRALAGAGLEGHAAAVPTGQVILEKLGNLWVH